MEKLMDGLGVFIILGFTVILMTINSICRWYEAHKYRKDTEINIK
jgi:hypothetical protein